MKLHCELEGKETGTPIELATAIINVYMNSTDYSFAEDRKLRINSLEELAEHVLVYVRHYKEVN